MAIIKNYLKLFRIKHYIKNILIFTTLVFCAEVFTSNFYTILIGFISFCLMSSTIYIINDIADYEADKITKSKQNEPLTSGKISKKQAIIALIITLVSSLVINYFTFSLYSYVYLLLYFGLNLLYSFWGKKQAYLELVLMISFYVIRIYYGAAILSVPVSIILNLTIIFGSLYIVVIKRIIELRNNKPRKIFKIYKEKILKTISTISLLLMLISYTLWSIWINIDLLYLTSIFIFIIFKEYYRDAIKSEDGNPVEILLRDKLLLLLCISYGIIIIMLVDVSL